MWRLGQVRFKLNIFLPSRRCLSKVPLYSVFGRNQRFTSKSASGHNSLTTLVHGNLKKLEAICCPIIYWSEKHLFCDAYCLHYINFWIYFIGLCLSCDRFFYLYINILVQYILDFHRFWLQYILKRKLSDFGWHGWRDTRHSRNTALCCTILCCTNLHKTAMHGTALLCSALHCTALDYPFYTAQHCTAIYCAVYCNWFTLLALLCTALHCSVSAARNHCREIITKGELLNFFVRPRRVEGSV